MNCLFFYEVQEPYMNTSSLESINAVYPVITREGDYTVASLTMLRISELCHQVPLSNNEIIIFLSIRIYIRSNNPNDRMYRVRLESIVRSE